MKNLINIILDNQTLVLWHPASPGMKNTVVRSRFGRWFKNPEFATLSESIRSGK